MVRLLMEEVAGTGRGCSALLPRGRRGERDTASSTAATLALAPPMTAP